MISRAHVSVLHLHSKPAPLLHPYSILFKSKAESSEDGYLSNAKENIADGITCTQTTRSRQLISQTVSSCSAIRKINYVHARPARSNLVYLETIIEMVPLRASPSLRPHPDPPRRYICGCRV